MVRPLRIEFPGALYHITDRGNERKAVFRDDADRHRLIQYFKEAVEKFGLKIHAFCLMGNHYHIEIETPRGNLSKSMQWVKTAYTVYFNKRHRRSGHLFQGRYKAALIEKDKYLLALTRYIHLNPVRAEMVKKPEEYYWSSYEDYIKAKRKWKWLEIGWTLDRFGGMNGNGRRLYRRFVEEGIPQKVLDPLQESISGIILGSDRFVEWIQEHLLNPRDDPPAVSASKEIRKIAMTEVICKVSEILNVPEEIISFEGLTLKFQ